MTAPPAVDTALQPARQRLADAIHKLTDPQPHTLDNSRRTWLDPIYQQLAAAVYARGTLGNSHSIHAAPLWFDASDTLTAIDHLATAEHPQHPGYTPQDRSQATAITHPTVLRLRNIDQRRWRPQDSSHIQQLAADIEALTARAENLLNPPTSWYLPDPCPICGNSHAHIGDGDDTIRKPALHITAEWCRCAVAGCKGFWPADEFQFLGRLLGYHPPEGLADPPNDTLVIHPTDSA